MRPKTFFFHYNKPQSTKAGKPQITVHYDGICHIVDNIICNVPTFGHLRTQQPRFVIKGKTKNFRIEKNIALIN